MQAIVCKWALEKSVFDIPGGGMVERGPVAELGSNSGEIMGSILIKIGEKRSGFRSSLCIPTKTRFCDTLVKNGGLRPDVRLLKAIF